MSHWQFDVLNELLIQVVWVVCIIIVTLGRTEMSGEGRPGKNDLHQRLLHYVERLACNSKLEYAQDSSELGDRSAYSCRSSPQLAGTEAD